MTLVQDETVQLGELAGWVNEGAITFVVGEMSFLKKITDEIGAYLHNTPLFPCLATHSVWYDHVRDELLPAGGGHAEEHRAARIQTDHCGGEALVQAHVDILKDIAVKCVYGAVLLRFSPAPDGGVAGAGEKPGAGVSGEGGSGSAGERSLLWFPEGSRTSRRGSESGEWAVITIVTILTIIITATIIITTITIMTCLQWLIPQDLVNNNVTEGDGGVL